MANRFPLVLDTSDNNKIKEIQTGDNLNLTDNSITGVQNITALGTIDAADIRVNGNRLVAQAFADLTDTPASFIGSPDYFVKVKADGTGLEYRPLSDLGNIEIDTITVDTSIVPSVNNVGNIGTEALKFNEIVATTLKGNLVSYNEEIVFDATTGKVSYAALQGAPIFLSEFTDDVGYLQTSDLNTTLAGLFDDGVPFTTDIVGSVFGDDSTVLVDAVNSIITGDVLNTSVDTATLTASQVTSTTVTAQLFEGPPVGDMQIDAGTSGVINIGFGVGTTAVNIDKAVIETFDQGTGLGVAQLTATTDLVINAGNRVKITGGVPFRFASTSAANQLAIGAQEGDVIYNTTTARLQMFQGGEWLDVNGNVQTTTGTSNFNDVVVAGNLIVQGTTTSIETTNTTITDNVIVLNEGEIGAGVTSTTAGIEIDRGTEPNRSLVWSENLGGKWIVTDSATFFADRVEANYLVGSLTVSTDNLVMGDGDITATGTLTVGGGELVQIVSVSTDIELLPVGKVFVDGNLEVTGLVTAPNITGDLKGSVFGDDSTVLVDSVNGIIPAANLSGTATITVIGDVTGNLTGNADTVTNGVYTTGDQTIAGVKTFSSAILSDVTGNIDNTTLTVGAVDATTIAIGNVSSTTTIKGTVNFGSAIIAANIIADDSISIATAAGTNNAVNLSPQGTNTSINLEANNIRLLGTVVSTINAQGGVIGDLKGSVVADDSTVLIDSVAGKIVGYVENDQYNYNTDTQSLRIGGGAGATSQGASAVAIGEGAGYNTQGNLAVAIGRGSGNVTQGIGAVGIGFCAGATEQGDYAVAIGFKAARGNMDADGTPNQPANSIMINASSTPLNGDQAGLYINPVREDVANTAKAVYYNATTKELTYADPTGGGGDGANLVSTDDINITINSLDSTSYSWNFNQLGFLEIPDINNQRSGRIGDIFEENMVGIQANPNDSNSYAALVSHDKQNAIDANSSGVSIYTDDAFQGGSVTRIWEFDRTGKLTLPTGGTITYTPATAGDWNGTAPTTIQAAIDRLATLVKALNGGTGA